MPNTLYLAPTANFIEKTLNGAINDAVSTVTLNNTTNLQAPGYAVIDRVDSSGTATPNAREVISYTGISGNDLTGVTRAADNSTARSHSDAAKVEFTVAAGIFNSLATIVSTAVTTDGYLKAINSPVSIAIGRFTQFVTPSLASIAQIHGVRAFLGTVTLTGSLHVSVASITGIGLSPAFLSPGIYSGPTLAIGGILIAPRPTTISWVAALTRYVVSTASVGFDFKIRNTSVFANATTRPSIAAGGTFVSTASIATRNINAGDLLQGDVATVGANGFVRQITIQAG